jgi:hypothetical protein
LAADENPRSHNAAHLERGNLRSSALAYVSFPAHRGATDRRPAAVRHTRRMTNLGEVLELMHGARHRVRTLRATVHEWSDEGGWRRAMDRHAERVDARGGGVASAMTTERATRVPRGASATVVRLWWQRDRLREERDPLGDEPPPFVAVFDGELHWAYSPPMGLVTNEGEPDARRHGRELRVPPLDPAALIPAYEFTVLGEAVQAGRPGIRVLARGRDEEDRRGRIPLPPGADECEFCSTPSADCCFGCQRGWRGRSSAGMRSSRSPSTRSWRTRPSACGRLTANPPQGE